MLTFLSGAIAMGFLLSALFFLRFWRRTGDGLFAIFAAAFLLLTANQTLAALIDFGREELSWVYLLRLAGFCLIITGIVAKNIRTRRA
jgi:hypothetical protein